MGNLGVNISRIGVAIVLLSVGFFKFTPTEAGWIFIDVSNSPILSWLYKLGSRQFVSNIIGAIEIITAILILFSFKNQKAALMGGIFGTITFLITLSFFFTTPAAVDATDKIMGMEHLSVFDDWCFAPNAFILKDIVFFGVCLQLAVENW